MRLLAFDGTAKLASVAVREDGKTFASYTIDNGLTQSELLLPMAEDMLRSLKLGFSDIDCYATSVGPGSFTGVRIGVSLIKGLAFGRDIPCVPVSTLEALAENLRPLDGIIVPCMDARRAQVYNAVFECSGGKLRRLTEDRAVSLQQLSEELEKYSGKRIYLSGDGYEIARQYLLCKGVMCESTPGALIGQSASSVAAVAERKLAAGETVSDRELSPIYLRMPQAERERLERIKNERK